MAIIEGSTTPKSVTAEYDFAKDGGTIGTKTLRGGDGWDNFVPAGSVVFSGYIELLTPVTSASTNTATIGLKLKGTDDLFHSATTPVSGAPWNAAGQVDLAIDGTGSDSIRVTAGASVQMTVAVAALTAGKFRVILFYK
jgi:hypothetical protein